jgi:formiminotetrahydrofolate cyclodeaminase
VKEVLAVSEILRKRLLEAIDIDAKAFEMVMVLLPRPRVPTRRKPCRREMIQTAFKERANSSRTLRLP